VCMCVCVFVCLCVCVYVCVCVLGVSVGFYISRILQALVFEFILKPEINLLY